jgi:hypothetical protein
MSIESFHRSLHGAVDSEPLLVKLRAITKIEDPALLAAGGEAVQGDGWANWMAVNPGSDIS